MQPSSQEPLTHTAADLACGAVLGDVIAGEHYYHQPQQQQQAVESRHVTAVPATTHPLQATMHALQHVSA
jgi:hypothetical protein